MTGDVWYWRLLLWTPYGRLSLKGSCKQSFDARYIVKHLLCSWWCDHDMMWRFMTVKCILFLRHLQTFSESRIILSASRWKSQSIWFCHHFRPRWPVDLSCVICLCEYTTSLGKLKPNRCFIVVASEWGQPVSCFSDDICWHTFPDLMGGPELSRRRPKRCQIMFEKTCFLVLIGWIMMSQCHKWQYLRQIAVLAIRVACTIERFWPCCHTPDRCGPPHDIERYPMYIPENGFELSSIDWKSTHVV